MLSVESPRAACMRSAARSNGGVDAAVVGSTASATVRLPLPPADNLGSIYENQGSLKNRYFTAALVAN